jgi:Domain of unknown function (DUF4203)
MEISLVDPWVRIFAIIIGLASCFYGYPLFRVFLVLTGLIYGFIYGQSFYPASHPFFSILIGVAAGLALALLAYPLWSFGVTAVGAAIGFMMLGELGVVLNFQEMGVILLSILGAVVLGLLFYRARDLFVIIATAYNGAVQVIYGIGLFQAARAIELGPQNFPAVAAIVVLGSLGFIIQYTMFKGRRKYAI